MPALVFAGRRWHISSDDLAWPAALGLVFHVTWTGIMIRGIISYPPGCKAHKFEAYLWAMLALFASLAVVESLLFWESTRGTLLQESKRRRVPLYMYLNGILGVCVVGFNILGSVAVWSQPSSCELTSVDVGPSPLAGIVISTWVAIFCGALILLMGYSSYPDRTLNAWEGTCRVLSYLMCCYGILESKEGETSQKPLARLAQVFYEVLNDFDFTFTDFIASLILVSVEQRRQRLLKVNYQYLIHDSTRMVAEDPEGQCTGPGEASSLVGRQALDGPGDVELGERVTTKDRLNTPSIFQKPAFEVPDVELQHVPVASGEPGPPPGTPEEGPPVPLAQLEEAEHYHKFANAAYGWQMFLWANRGRQTHRCCLLCCGGSCNCWDCGSLGWDDYTKCPEDEVEIDVTRPSAGIMDTLRGKMKSLGARRRRSIARQKPPSLAQAINRQVVVQVTGINDSDILYLNTTDSLEGLVPYFVALDRDRQAVVVSVRGSLSVENVATDFLTAAVPLDPDWVEVNNALSYNSQNVPLKQHMSRTETQPDRTNCVRSGVMEVKEEVGMKQISPVMDGEVADPSADGGVAGHPGPPPTPEVYVHEGIYACAKAILRDLEANGILEALYGNGPHPTIVGGSRIPPDCHSWPLVLTGHSLGAGVSCLLGLYYQSRMQEVKIWAFAPPAGLMSPEGNAMIEPICTSLVYGKDMIPRMSLATIEKLRDDMLVAAIHCKLSKPYIILPTWFGKQLKFEDVFVPTADLNEDLLRQYQETKQLMEAPKKDADVRLRHSRRFQIPGRIIYLQRFKVKSEGRWPSVQEYVRPKVCSGQELMQEGLLVSRRMFTDHFPDHQFVVLHRLVKQMQQA